MAKIITRFALGIMVIYFWSLAAFIPYYNWKYANTNSFVDWLFLGELRATAHALVWPYYFFAAPRDFATPSDTWSHFIAATDYFKKSAGLDDLFYQALSEAEQVDGAELNTLYLGLGDHFRDEFAEGLKLIVSTHRGHDIVGYLKAEYLLHQYMVWYNTHYDDIRRAVEQQAGPT